MLSVVEKQQVRQDGMICKIWFLVYLVFEITIDRKKPHFSNTQIKCPAQGQLLIFLQVADKTRKEMNVAFGQRLSEIVTDSASISGPPKTSTQSRSIPVNEIVYKSKLAYAWSACLKQRRTLRNPSMFLLWLKYKRSQKFGRKF